MDLQINKRIKKLRKDAGLTQEQTAVILGIKHSTYAQMERKGGIHIDIALKLSEIFNVSLDRIIYGEKPEDNLSPKTIIMKTPTPIEDIYKQNPDPKPKQDALVLSSLEENMILIYRNSKPDQKKEIRDFFKNRV